MTTTSTTGGNPAPVRSPPRYRGLSGALAHGLLVAGIIAVLGLLGGGARPRQVGLSFGGLATGAQRGGRNSHDHRRTFDHLQHESRRRPRLPARCAETDERRCRRWMADLRLA